MSGIVKSDEKADANLKVLLEKFEGLEKKFNEKFDRLEKKFDGLEKKVDANQQEILAAFSCLPLALGSVATGLREAAAGGPVLAFVTASRADVAAWLKEVGFEQYEKPLAPLGGAGLLLQTPASLARLGVLPEHVPLLLKDIDKASKRAHDAHDAC
jgi:hypothetical protein